MASNQSGNERESGPGRDANARQPGPGRGNERRPGFGRGHDRGGRGFGRGDYRGRGFGRGAYMRGGPDFGRGAFMRGGPDFGRGRGRGISDSDEKSQVVLTASTGLKRGFEDDQPDSRHGKKPRLPAPEPTFTQRCGNCGTEGHKARDCVKVGRTGWMDGACPKCNYPGHVYEACPIRLKSQDIDYLFWYRQNKGMVKSSMNIAKLLRTTIQEGRDPRFRLNEQVPPPYSPKFARQIQRDFGWQSWRYTCEGRPDVEATRRKYEPEFFKWTLGNVAQIEHLGGWDPSQDGVDLSQDGPTPSLNANQLPRQREMPQGFLAQTPQAIRAPQATRAPQAPEVPQAPEATQAPERAQEGQEAAPVTYTASHLDNICLEIVKNDRRGEAESRHRSTSRALQPSTMLMKEIHTKFTEAETQYSCDNCGKTHKKGERCDQRCAACGEDGHAIAICPLKENACLCEEYPGHTRENLCPVQECRTPLDCETHCVGCGYEKELDGKRGMDRHKCEWIKSMAVPEMPTLFCKEHREHHVSTDSLQDGRREEVERLLKNKEYKIKPECLSCRAGSSDMEVDVD
ncbi:hypothetical protein ABKA04_002226 [Annulohypoxylon sp. FPYF3050]